ncbi:hypothetical protein BZA05DRAFT_32399 [Tricharina praecox]|uniref:uncharacterized protein n=1 Tax=Tricharina praecox TaxID=43433 RepID=UPI00221F295A|nr:uncharacterized protein BZA05DRAFT_32399 [Tricharina praecox]KAI5853541.1 hypothetical protein BZA05DRAFT_32399 [Tricharina praecox]
MLQSLLSRAQTRRGGAAPVHQLHVKNFTESLLALRIFFERETFAPLASALHRHPPCGIFALRLISLNRSLIITRGVSSGNVDGGGYKTVSRLTTAAAAAAPHAHQYLRSISSRFQEEKKETKRNETRQRPKRTGCAFPRLRAGPPSSGVREKKQNREAVTRIGLPEKSKIRSCTFHATARRHHEIRWTRIDQEGSYGSSSSSSDCRWEDADLGGRVRRLRGQSLVGAKGRRKSRSSDGSNGRSSGISINVNIGSR